MSFIGDVAGHALVWLVLVVVGAVIVGALGWAVWTAGYIVWGAVRVFAVGVKRGLGR